MADKFYRLKNENPKKIKKVLLWAKENSKKTKVDILNFNISMARIKSDKSFSEVMNLIDENVKGFFRIILRKDQNIFGLFSNKKEFKDYLEIGVRGIDVDNKEYFIFIYLDKNKLSELKKKFEVKEK